MKLKYPAAVVLTVVLASIAVIALEVGGGAAKTRGSQTAARSVITVRSTSLGKTLVDGSGRTLYLFEADRTNVSTLSRAGRTVWPPFTAAGTLKARGGAQTAKLGTATGPGGTRQVSYNGHPLYYYVGDSQPGSTRGQHLKEFGALWYVLGPKGGAITTASRTPRPASPAPAPAAGGRYGY
jgi:predicted lipoprotein with Yx(FWY)xxD motif